MAVPTEISNVIEDVTGLKFDRHSQFIDFSRYVCDQYIRDKIKIEK